MALPQRRPGISAHAGDTTTNSQRHPASAALLTDIRTCHRPTRHQRVPAPAPAATVLVPGRDGGVNGEPW
ncbi:hypothetical protein ACFC1R_30455 [Kitasatospora sp. NPDC056138]|uniref:hypothetical protein n=1 Tax=Kitasatospora sp. NPDC056138 TaxID=3345724 RepID=UPI0035DDBD03